MINTTGHIDRMKVNSAELKTHLGQYLRTVEHESTTLEVCVRDRTVAYLVPAHQSEPQPAGGKNFPLLALQLAGMKIDFAGSIQQKDSLPEPVLAGDGQENVVTVEQMRQGRDW